MITSATSPTDMNSPVVRVYLCASGISKVLDTSWKVRPGKVNDVMLMVSEKWRIRIPMFISSSKLSKVGTAVSFMKKRACNGFSLVISMTLLSAGSVMKKGSILMYVLLMLVQRSSICLITLRSSFEIIKSMEKPFGESV